MSKTIFRFLLLANLLLLPKLSQAGTTNFISKFDTPSTVNDSLLYDDGTSIGFGTTTPGIVNPGVPAFTLLNNLNSAILELGTTGASNSFPVGRIYFLDTSAPGVQGGLAYIDTTATKTGSQYGGDINFATKPAVSSGVPAIRVTIDTNGRLGIGTRKPAHFVGLGGSTDRTLGMENNIVAGSTGKSLTINAGGPKTGSTDLAGGDLIMASGNGTGLGGSGNARIQTAGAADASGTGDNLLVDREIVVGKAKQMTLASPGFTSLASFLLTGTHTAGGRIYYLVRATDGGSQIATEEGIIQFAATANSITCTVQTADKLHLGTVNSGCTPGFFNPGSHPGISVFDNVSFSSPAPIVVHEVYFRITNESQAAVRLEP